MIEFQRLIGHNFITYLHLDIPLNKQGVVSIEGINKDTGGSNGAGKSTIAYLLEYILYGTISTSSSSGDTIVGVNDNGYYGIVFWKKNGKKYKVIQWRGTCEYSKKYNKSKGLKIFEDGKSIERGKNLTEIQKQVAVVLGLTHEEFLGSVLLSGEDHVLLKGKPSARISFLSGPFKLYVYDYILKEIKSDIKELNNTFRELELVQAKKERAEEVLNKFGSLRKANADLERYKEEFSNSKNELSTLKEKRDAILEYLTLTKDIKPKELKSVDVKKLKADIQLVKEEIDELESKIRKRTVYLEKVKEYETISNKLKNCKKVDVEKLEVKIKFLTKEIADMEADYRLQIETISKFKNIKGKSVCPTCYREFSEKDKEKIKGIVGKAEKKAESLVEETEEAKETLDKIEDLKTQGNMYESLKSKLPEGVKEGDKVKNIQESLDALEERLDTLEDTKETLYKRIQNTENLVKKLKELNVDASELESVIAKKEKEKDKLDESIDTLDNSVSVLRSKIKTIEDSKQEFFEVREEIKGYEEELSVLGSLKRKESYLRVLEEAYGPRGLKLDKIRIIIERFQRILPKYTSVLFSERGIRFKVKGDDKELGFIVKRKKSKELDIKSLSKGESRRMNLGLTFMVKDSLPYSKETNLVILDEIDNGLDELGKNVLLNDFLPDLKSKIGTIIIISHNKSIAQAPILDKHWIAKKENECSELI